MAKRQVEKLNRVSRRDFLFAAGLGSVGLAAAGTLASPARASSKMSPKAMQYRPTPNGNQRCDNCANWLPPGQCKLVDGPIAPPGWCILYRPRK
jgi:anaerobic selenocysteine-containing dehydrogenase